MNSHKFFPTNAFRGDTVRYKDVSNWQVTAPTFSVNRNTALGTCSVLVDMLSVQQTTTLTASNAVFVLIGSAGDATSQFAMSI